MHGFFFPILREFLQSHTLPSEMGWNVRNQTESSKIGWIRPISDITVCDRTDRSKIRRIDVRRMKPSEIRKTRWKRCPLKGLWERTEKSKNGRIRRSNRLEIRQEKSTEKTKPFQIGHNSLKSSCIETVRKWTKTSKIEPDQPKIVVIIIERNFSSQDGNAKVEFDWKINLCFWLKFRKWLEVFIVSNSAAPQL